MAYNKRYNPDALPAHVEPEQAASMLSSSDRPLPDRTGGPRRTDSYSRSERDPYASSRPPPPSSSSSRDSYRGSTQPRPLDDRERDRDRDRDQRRRYSRDSYPPPEVQSSSSARYKDDRYKDDRGAPPASSSTRGGAPADRYASPPPQSYGYQSMGPPPKEHHNRPPQQAPQTPGPPPPRDAGDRESLYPLFTAVDKDRSGALDERELRTALVNGDMSSFDPHTVKMMIRMFDTDRSGTINFDEFCGLWSFLAAWRTLFDRFDVDKSGNISYDEFSDALVAFGYRLSPAFVSLLFRTYDRRNDNAMSFDLFVQACISLKRMTDVFKKYDDDRDGYITLSFEEFLTEILRQLG